MTSRDFCYWLQGYFEVAGPSKLTPTQIKMIKNHLNMVFKHEIDPGMGDAIHQVKLNKLHFGKQNTEKPSKVHDELIRC